jgi:hypothetical protein
LAVATPCACFEQQGVRGPFSRENPRIGGRPECRRKGAGLISAIALRPLISRKAC